MRKTIFILLAVMTVLTTVAAVSADQEGNSCWCNNDQYGCWITGEKGGKDYIMFWSESARDYIMGPGFKAPLADRFFMDKLPLECGFAEIHAAADAPGAEQNNGNDPGSGPAEQNDGNDPGSGPAETPTNPCDLDCGFDPPYYDASTGTCLCLG